MPFRLNKAGISLDSRTDFIILPPLDLTDWSMVKEGTGWKGARVVKGSLSQNPDWGPRYRGCEFEPFCHAAHMVSTKKIIKRWFPNSGSCGVTLYVVQTLIPSSTPATMLLDQSIHEFTRA
jgi:hypothetical protein